LVAAIALLVLAAGCGEKNPADLHLRRAAEFLAAHRPKAAATEIRAAIRIAPSRADVYREAVALYSSASRPREAGRIAQLELDARRFGKLDAKLSREEVASLYSVVGYGLQKARDLTGAERAYKDALAQAPSSPQLLNALGYFYADEGIKLDQALRLTRQAVHLAPQDGNILDSLGWAQYKLGDFAAAVRTLARAVEMSPDEAEIRYHLGAAYAKRGHITDARIELRKALLLDSGLSKAVRLLRSLKQ